MSAVAPRSGDGSGARGPGRWFAWGLLALVAALLVWVLTQVNAVPRLQEAVKAAWAQVAPSLQPFQESQPPWWPKPWLGGRATPPPAPPPRCITMRSQPASSFRPWVAPHR